MRKKVMIVEDDPLNRRLFADVLTSEGIDAVPVDRAGEAAAVARTERPDLILMDICMPDSDGFETTMRLKKDKSTSGIPVIAITALTGSEDETLARDQGCVEYLNKPISIPGFLKCVNRYLN